VLVAQRVTADTISMLNWCSGIVCGMRGRQMAMSPTRYLTVNVDGLKVFYRDAGPSDAPAVLLLHGFPLNSDLLYRN
jgi:hypothetical protein